MEPQNLATSIDTSRVTWNLDLVLSDPDGLEAQQDAARVREANQRFADKWRNRTDYLNDAQVLRSALDDYEALQHDSGVSPTYGFDAKRGYHYWLQAQIDSGNASATAKRQQSVDAATEISDLIRFFELSLGKIEPDVQQRFLADSNLEEYRHFLERIFVQAKYQLDESVEKVIDLKQAASYQKWVDLTEKLLYAQQRNITLANGDCEPHNLGQILKLVSDNDKPTRDDAAKALNDILRSCLEVAEAEINAILANKKVDDELRGFERPDAARHLADDIDSAIVDTMLDSVDARQDISHRFYRLKADLLSLSTLAYHERNVRYGKISQTYDWNTSCEIVNDVYSELDPEFGEVFRNYLTNGHFDVYPSKGKIGGAFCYRYLKSTPSYVLLNHTNQLGDVITLAHEFGHGLNNEYMRRNQNALNFGIGVSTAEVASQYLEDFFYDRILADADDETRLAVNMSRLNDAVNKINRQVSCYRFEQALHAAYRQNGYLSAVKIGELFHAHMAAYMGPAVEHPSGAENSWVYWWHIRRFFYVYSYASGLLIAKAMQNLTRQDKTFLSEVKQFLSTGTSASPRDIFQRMGIDITDKAFWNEGLDEIEGLLEETEKLAVKLGKLSAE